ncbi:Lrp/AsnC family transcriptional regulator [Rouxiella badensis]|jgi:Lrp/AsnC family transcriptional regulator|uniref:DNA-binding transcriptional activator DecR n=1 Tax=Rouxiella badensis TaxID=1646377 RepID=A0A1X0WJC5_9GAMM|nr:Lrp/AsnC family transcriptional regulator [Rouxiella badensis]MCC3702186.1 Lrp/AsnC family transcriptional regulator [Rouxiella badensis]MCC3717192.1 Lrp/AsnC family transcriptional regulator [Rouxiella badensis]MCC3728288.1 Lrp/AsnC family transcriptional regulator [Rouxiella badensis]MCC3732192.1 Lrp/AsnC family transcriptional regulator [Rouxiella badensis]MCC3740032.1 Lrp/AsnC family transcriptional regulator [Rouxiella badensis]
MIDKTDRKLLALLQQDCTLSLNELAEAVNLTSTPCWKRIKKLEEEGVILGKVALLDGDKLGLSLTAFVRIKTQQHSSQWYQNFVEQIESFPEVLSFYRMAGEYDYLMQVQVADMKSYDNFYKKLVSAVPGLLDVTSNFAMERIKSTTHLPL